MAQSPAEAARALESWRAGARVLSAATAGKGAAALAGLEASDLEMVLGGEVVADPDVQSLLVAFRDSPDAVRRALTSGGDDALSDYQFRKVAGILGHLGTQPLVGGPPTAALDELLAAAQQAWKDAGGSKAPKARMTEAMEAVVAPRIAANPALAELLYETIRTNPGNVIPGKMLREALARGLGKSALEQGIPCGGSIADPTALLQRQLASAAVLAGVRPMPRAEGHAVQARLSGVPGDVTVRVDPTLDRVFDAFGRWEKALASQGVEAEFFIGAGEVRRALYGLPSEGPGDFEVFFHIKNKPVAQKLVIALKQIREDWGVDIKGDLQAILGPNKELDIMYKDSRALSKGGPWINKLGFFDDANEAADTSVNGLLYAPSRELLIDPLHASDSPNLRALTEGKILYTEPAASAQLENPVEVPGTFAWSYYSGRIVRQALRSIRADIDLALSPNPNGLVLDEGFRLPVSGFDLFFSGVPSAELAGHPMDEIYMGLFLKIFRNRTNEELATIRDILTTHYPRTYETWKQLGLDVDLLLEPRTAKTNVRDLEQRALQRQVRYEKLWPLITQRGVMRDPFSNKAAMRDLLATLSTPKGSPGVAPVPLETLRRIDPRLAHRTMTFDSLPLSEKLSTVTSYLSLAHTLAHPAAGRLGLVGVREKIFPRVPFLRTGSLTADDGRTLGAFIADEIQAVGNQSPRLSVSAADFNAAAAARIDGAIVAAQDADATPVIFVDLDDTLFLYASRVVRILQQFDESRGTSYFSGLKPSDLPAGDYAVSIYGWLDGKVPLDELAGVADAAAEYVVQERGTREIIQKDDISPNLVAMLGRWQDAGAQIVYVTSRAGWMKAGTETALERAPPGELILAEWDEKAGAWRKKSDQINEYLAKHGEARGVAVLDNDRSVLSDIAKNTDVVALRTVLRNTDGTPTVFLLDDDAQIYEVLATQPPR